MWRTSQIDREGRDDRQDRVRASRRTGSRAPSRTTPDRPRRAASCGRQHLCRGRRRSFAPSQRSFSATEALYQFIERRDQQADDEVEGHQQQHAFELAPGLVHGDAAERRAHVHVADHDGERGVLGQVQVLRDQRRDDDAQRLGQDHEAHGAVRAAGRAPSAASVWPRETAWMPARTILGDEGAGVERQREPERDQRLVDEAAALEVEAAGARESRG